MSNEDQNNNAKPIKSARTLKIWNVRVHGHKYQRHHAYVAAYSMKQAAEMLSMAFYGSEHKDLISINEISKYYHKGAWGNDMNGIEPVEPCVYLCDSSGKPFRVI